MCMCVYDFIIVYVYENRKKEKKNNKNCLIIVMKIKLPSFLFKKNIYGLYMITSGSYNNNLPIMVCFPFSGDLCCVPYSSYIYIYTLTRSASLTP